MAANGTSICLKCGFHNEFLANYCAFCGKELGSRCPFCMAEVHSHHNYCSSCGRQLLRPPDQPRAQQSMAPLVSIPAGEWKIASILFADIASSTVLIGNHDAEDTKRILKPTIDIMLDIAHRYEGITREEGDGIMACFGAPIALEDHAVRACHVAVDIQEAMRSRADAVRREFGTIFQVRIGINSGPVVVTSKMGLADFRVDGMPIHIAKRLESVTPPGKILLTRETVALAEGFVAVTGIGPLTLKDVAKRVDVYELEGINTRMRIHARAARGWSKFVGRREEIERLKEAAANARSGRGQVVALVGEAGVGKSRIFLEFTKSLHCDGWLLLAAESVSYGRTTSYRPLLDFLSHYFEIRSRDDEQLTRENITKKLLALSDEKLLMQMPFFTGAFGVTTSDGAWTGLTPLERQNQLFSATKRLLIRESQNQPLCLILEDLHWVDQETQTFVELLIESIAAARILVLINHRPDYKTLWIGKSNLSYLRIDPLPVASADELLEQLLGAHAGLDSIKNTLIKVSQGNPLFLEESVQSLIESGVLDKSSGQWRLVGEIPAEFVPRTIESLLAERIDRLLPELKEILQCAAVIGDEVEGVLLEAVTGLRPSDLAQGLQALQAKELLYEKLLAEVQYAFKHSMTREVAYGSLLRERRTVLHARVVCALETLMEGRIEEQVERLAEHAERGRVWDKALNYLQRAGSKAYLLYANSDAASYFERALEIIPMLPQTRENLELTVDLHFELRNALLPSGELDQIIDLLQQVEPTLAALDDKLRSARHAAFRCNYHFLVGEQRSAIEFAERGLLLARECAERTIEGELLYRLGQSYGALGEFRRAIAILEKSLVFTEDKPARSRSGLSVIPSVVNRFWLVNALLEIGDFASGMRHARQALGIAERAEHPLSQVLGWLSIGQALSRKGELEGAIGALERGLDLCDKWQAPVWRPRLLSTLGVVYARKGRIAEASRFAQQAVCDAERMRMNVDMAGMLLRLGETSLLAGQLSDALTVGTRAIEIAVKQQAKGDEGWARFLCARACLALRPQKVDESAKQLDMALQLALTCEIRPLAAYCQQTIGAIHELQGNKAKAFNFLECASASYQELGIQPLVIDLAR
jgi:class 3 adenylate cyclase/tetratricopeptide (TPR) repeat protein